MLADPCEVLFLFVCVNLLFNQGTCPIISVLDYNLLDIINAVIATLATAAIAIFTYFLYQINRRQHKSDYKQELILHPSEPTFVIVGGERAS